MAPSISVNWQAVAGGSTMQHVQTYVPRFIDVQHRTEAGDFPPVLETKRLYVISAANQCSVLILFTHVQHTSSAAGRASHIRKRVSLDGRYGRMGVGSTSSRQAIPVVERRRSTAIELYF